MGHAIFMEVSVQGNISLIGHAIWPRLDFATMHTVKQKSWPCQVNELKMLSTENV